MIWIWGDGRLSIAGAIVYRRRSGAPQWQGWQVSANSGLDRGLNRFKPSWQKQVFAGFYQTWYNNCSIKIMLTV